MTDDEAPGWTAIDAALQRIYGDAKPQHWGTLIRWRLGGPDPLDGISAYRREDPVPHWHYIGYGMSALYENDDPTSDLSDWGFEFTFRLARGDEEQAPIWPASLLQNLARYVHQSGNWFEAGHHLDLNGPIAADRPTQLTKAFFALDPELGTIDTPHGTVEFLQVVGVTADEHQAGQDWNTLGVLDVLLPWLPLLVTDLDRGSLLRDPLNAHAVRRGTERDGSSTGILFVDTGEWRAEPGGGFTLTVGANGAASLGRSLAGRLPHGRDLTLTTGSTQLRFTTGPALAATESDGETVLSLPPATVDELRAVLLPSRGRHPIAAAPGLTLVIEPTQLKDADGSPTGEVIG
jgi:suppressor of fused-like protein